MQARIGNGEVDVALDLRSPAGVQIGSTERAEVYVRAEWEGIGITVLAVLVGGLLVIGLVRTIRHRQRAATAGDSDRDRDGEVDEDDAEDPASATPQDDR